MDAKHTILRLAQVAEAIAWHAGVGGCETAGAIVSYLAANPERIDTFLTDGLLDALDAPAGHPRDLHLDGLLTWHKKDGDVISPAEARAARDAKRRILGNLS